MSADMSQMKDNVLSHLDSDGDITMVDVSAKIATTREAHAMGLVLSLIHI